MRTSNKLSVSLVNKTDYSKHADDSKINISTYSLIRSKILEKIRRDRREKFLEALKEAFFDRLLCKGSISLKGIGILRMGYSIGPVKGKESSCVGVIISDTSVGNNKDVTDGIWKCLDFDKAEQAIRN